MGWQAAHVPTNPDPAALLTSSAAPTLRRALGNTRFQLGKRSFDLAHARRASANCSGGRRLRDPHRRTAGIAISLNERVARVVLYVAAILMTGAVGRAVRLVNPGTVTDWARHRSLAGCDRTFPLFAIAKSKLISINATLGSPLVVPESALIGQQRMGQNPLP